MSKRDSETEVTQPSARLVLLLATVICAFLSIVPLSACSSDDTDPFLSELAAAPRIAGTSQTDITALVGKYIAPDMPLEDALKFLETRGFKKIRVTSGVVPSGQQWFIADRDKRQKLILVETTRVSIQSDGRRVLKASGRIFMSGM
jgi:hypothetical protein